jgi:hypothetical protein
MTNQLTQQETTEFIHKLELIYAAMQVLLELQENDRLNYANDEQILANIPYNRKEEVKQALDKVNKVLENNP